MGSVINKVTDAIGLTDSDAGERAADASRYAADESVRAQMEALDFLKEQSALPTALRDKALNQLGTIFSSPTGFLDYKTSIMEGVQESPLYESQLSQMEEATLRNRAATGGLRGGGSIADIANVQNNLINTLTSEAVGTQLGGLQSLAGLGTNANQIASLMGQIGQTRAQGITGAAQADVAGSQQNISNLLGLGQLGIGGALAFSDERLKDNITEISSTSHPMINKYIWDWNDKAKALGKDGRDSGYLAGEIEEVWPELVEVHGSGYKRIDILNVEQKLSELKNG